MTILDTLKKLDEQRGDEIESWFVEKRAQAAPFFYSSVDLRHSGLRLAPVDTNLFPAGFNNLSPAARARAARFVTHFLEAHFPHTKRVVIIPENHTRNMGYLENLGALLAIFGSISIEAQLGSLIAPEGQPVELETPSGRKLVEYPMKRDNGRLVLENGFVPDLIILNNDMTSGYPQLLENVTQPVLPPLGMGWYRRRKSVHFGEYKKLAEEFGAKFGIDPWLIYAQSYHCGLVDFKERSRLERVAKDVDAVLAHMREKYQEYGVNEEPYVFVKADSGTYGMGIMTARSAEDILELNKKERNKMQTIKEGARVSEVIIQEGIPTIDRVDGKVAEPLVYIIDGVPIGGMYRVNGERDEYNNLNAAGMEFTGMCDETEDECGQWKAVENCHFRSYGIVAAIAALAAAREDYEMGRDGAGI